MNADEKRQIKEEKYRQKLLKLIDDADSLDKRIVRNSKTLVKRMRTEILAHTAEAQSASSSGIEPSWGAYWHEKVRRGYNEIVERIGQQFHQDLSRFLIQSTHNGATMADRGYGPSIQLIDNRIDPELLKITSSFSADLITGLNRHSMNEINKQIALSANQRGGATDLMRRLSEPLDKGPWGSITYKQEIIGRTENSRVMELGRILRTRQLQRANPTMHLLQQFLCEPRGKYPCARCFSYDGNVYDVDGNLVIRADGKREGPMPAIPIHPFCFTGETKVKVHGKLEKVYRRRYSGPMIRIEFLGKDGGLDFFCVTPNHPILCPRGWVAAGELVEGDNLIQNDLAKDFSGQNLYVDNPDTTLEQIFESAKTHGFSENISGASSHFHGDGQNSDVDIISVDRELSNGTQPDILKSFKDNLFVLLNFALGSLSSLRGLSQAFLSSCPSCHSSTLLNSAGFVPDLLSLAKSTNGHAVFDKNFSNSGPNHVKSLGNLEFGDSLTVKSDNLLGELVGKAALSTTRIVSASRYHFDGHVYNLQTSTGFYAATGIPSKNCFCYIVPYVSGWSPEPAKHSDQPLPVNDVQIRYNPMLEGWTVKFSEESHVPVNTIRLNQRASNDELIQAAREISRNYSIDPDSLQFKIQRPSDESKPTGNQKTVMDELREASKSSRWHGVAKSYHSWRGMKDRCGNPNDKDYARYGGRGIKICKEWLEDYAQFAEDMGEPEEGQTLDRKDNDGDYTPANCRWASHKVQANNRSPK